MMDAFSVIRQIILKELQHISMKITPYRLRLLAGRL